MSHKSLPLVALALRSLADAIDAMTSIEKPADPGPITKAQVEACRNSVTPTPNTYADKAPAVEPEQETQVDPAPAPAARKPGRPAKAKDEGAPAAPKQEKVEPKAEEATGYTPGELAVAARTKFTSLVSCDQDLAVELLTEFKVAKFREVPAEKHAAFLAATEKAMAKAQKRAAAKAALE